MQMIARSVWHCPPQKVILYCLYAVGTVKLSVIQSREVSAIQRFLMYSINGVQSVRYKAGVRGDHKEGFHCIAQFATNCSLKPY